MTKLRQLLHNILLLLAAGCAGAPALGGTLVPNAQQTFVDANGQPYAGGQVYFYSPNTLTPKTTWKDALETIPNANPVALDSAGRAIIYGDGTYRQILKDQFGNTIWDQLTQGQGGGLGTVINAPLVGSATITSCAGVYPINNTSAAPITINMPTSPQSGDSCLFTDSGNNSSTYPITFNFGSLKLITGGSSFLLFSSSGSVSFVWQGTPASWAVE